MNGSFAIRDATPADVRRLAAAGRSFFLAAYEHLSDADDMAAHLAAHFAPEVVGTELAKSGVRYLLATDGDGSSASSSCTAAASRPG